MSRAALILAALAWLGCSNAALAQSKDQVTKVERKGATSQRAANGCPNNAPLACAGTDACCPTDTPNLCQSLRYRHPDGIAPVGWSGCVRPCTPESWKFWSDGCQPIWVRCN